MFDNEPTIMQPVSSEHAIDTPPAEGPRTARTDSRGTGWGWAPSPPYYINMNEILTIALIILLVLLRLSAVVSVSRGFV